MEVRDFEAQPDDRAASAASVALSRIRLRHLSCFVVVAQERTLARAADRLHLSQPAVSKTLSELERLAGRQLLERGRAGTLLAEAIARLHRRRPYAGVRVRMGANPELLAALRVGEVDFAVGRMAEPAMMQGVSFELLYAESLAVVTRPQHPLATRGDSSLSLLAVLEYPLVIPDVDTAPRHDVEGFFETHGIALPPGRTETQSVSVARALTLLSDAVWITPQRPVQLDIDSGWLHRLNVPVPGSAEPVGLLSRSGATPTELAAHLMDTLRDLS